MTQHMKNFEGYVLVSDFDGTLIGANSVISKENIDAIGDFVARGGLFCGATGRTQLSLDTYRENLPHVAPWILYNGAALYDFENKKFLFTDPVDKVALTPHVEEIMKAFPSVDVQVYTEDMLYVVNKEGERDPVIDAENHPHEFRAMGDIKKPWLKMLFRGDKSLLRQVEHQLEKMLNPQIFRYFYSGHFYLEVTAADVSKGRGVRALREHLGERAQRIMAIGDYFNDVEMLQWADISAAPANAPKEIRDLVDIVTTSNEDHAVRDFIRWVEHQGQWMSR